jgi:hypothetical protein
MAGGTRFVSTTRWFLNLLSASAICMSIFGRHPPVGFAMKFFAFAFLIAAWVMFWRSVAHKFHWSGIIRGLIPSVLFLAPMAALHALDRSLGSQKGDWAGAVLILAVISVVCVKRETPGGTGFSLLEQSP